MTEQLLKRLWDIVELDTLSEALRKQPRHYVKQSWKLIYSILGPRRGQEFRANLIIYVYVFSSHWEPSWREQGVKQSWSL